MTRALDKLEVSIRPGPSQVAGGFEGNHGVLRVGENQNRRPDRRNGVLQLVELAQPGTPVRLSSRNRCRTKRLGPYLPMPRRRRSARETQGRPPSKVQGWPPGR